MPWGRFHFPQALGRPKPWGLFDSPPHALGRARVEPRPGSLSLRWRDQPSLRGGNHLINTDDPYIVSSAQGLMEVLQGFRRWEPILVTEFQMYMFLFIDAP